jgi:hypothetical protein
MNKLFSNSILLFNNRSLYLYFNDDNQIGETVPMIGRPVGTILAVVVNTLVGKLPWEIVAGIGIGAELAVAAEKAHQRINTNAITPNGTAIPTAIAVA